MSEDATASKSAQPPAPSMTPIQTGRVLVSLASDLDRTCVLAKPLTLRVYALGGERIKGHIDSFQRGTGSTFALLPPENATGNFVKVVQRIPVKIVLDGPAKTLTRLAPGMSVEAKVAIRPISGWLSPFL